MKVIAVSTAFGLGWLFRLTVAQTIAIAASGLFTFVGEAGRKPNVRLAVRHGGARSGQPVAGGPARRAVRFSPARWEPRDQSRSRA